MSRKNLFSRFGVHAKLASIWDRTNRVPKQVKDTDRTVWLEGDTLWVYGPIGADMWSDGVDVEPMIKQIASSKSKSLNVRINSPGGDAFDGMALANSIRQFGGKTTGAIDGLAASAAAIVAASVDELSVHDGSSMMIHDAWGMMIGNAQDAEEFAELLHKLDGGIAGMLAKKSGQSAEGVREMMDAETWLVGEEIVEAGFADALQEDNPDKPENAARFNLDVFANAPGLVRQMYGGGTLPPLAHRPELAAAAALSLMDLG